MALQRSPHTLETNWREAGIIALEEKTRALDDWLDHTADLIAMFEGDNHMLHELNATASLVKSKKNDIMDEIEKQKEKANDMDHLDQRS